MFFTKKYIIFVNKLGSRSLSGKFNSSTTQGSTHSVTWSLELVTIIAMPPTHHPPENFLSK